LEKKKIIKCEKIIKEIKNHSVKMFINIYTSHFIYNYIRKL